MKVALRKPVTLAGNTVSELTFREEIVAGDMRGIKISSLADLSTDDVLKIAGRLCGQTDALMSQLSFPDLCKVTEVVGNFLSAGLETGTAA